ncbi:sodium/proton antiporter, NhaB family [Pseudomonas chlororaphis]|uniref:Na(+)/H(+) antiporter NhaB n=2 Tax=Pseudomonas chlororaphis TaxID=587753 RepID=A0AAQ1FJC6_9PSED|nr:sodium/proton antiporter NhaB [Pseudomonas chlororaphis]AIS13118.1 sodium/proton antiporter [Pseudomonas chlororaphis subsp. aurantiaca]AUG40987.1 sodium/proton antiporter NhaB [Pseudomonas chlororaphis]AZD66789.1 Na+/H+ antiporter NhaB [Pseudomonas chlororaphis subsp. aurantiaca]AZD73271.1 Na+/H+ antiporter NhaB [Pseudomonas chlororaphis subsp. aurantiaca]AZD79501.1 Na+/H+ antiporter NhaB [Pseudomonas chlororaphis subsp. aurantiaca]
MSGSLAQAFTHNFLGHSPRWYKASILAFLLLNPLLLFTVGPVAAGWMLVAEFIFALAMALKCYPLMPGGLLVLEAVALGMTTPQALYDELVHNFPVILLLMFMVAGIYFMKELLLFLFSRLLLGVRSKALLGLLFCFLSAFLSAFLDALTVTAVIISAAVGFYSVYHRVASGNDPRQDSEFNDDQHLPLLHHQDLEQFRAFLRSLLMHGAVGTALGGVCTLVGEPQNLLIGHEMGWHFADFFLKVAPVSLPVLVAGLVTCVLLEKLRWFGYGTLLPDNVRAVLANYAAEDNAERTDRQRAALLVQGVAALILIAALALHIAEVGLIGLMVIVLITAFTGITDEHRLGNAFKDAMPFTALLVVFFAVVAVIHDQQLFTPLIQWVLALPAGQQPGMLFIANGLLSAISDNVFVATIYITEVKQAFVSGQMSREHFETLAVAINTGTNLPSVATPNGQAAFLFLLTSAIAPLVRLSYGRMVWMALPYTLVMGVLGWYAVSYWL